MLAAAGLDRLQLDLSDLDCFDLPVNQLAGAPGQGALGIQARADDQAVLDVMRQLEDLRAELTSRCERLLLRELGADSDSDLAQTRSDTAELRAQEPHERLTAEARAHSFREVRVRRLEGHRFLLPPGARRRRPLRSGWVRP